MLDNAPDVTVAMRCSRENPGCRGRARSGQPPSGWASRASRSNRRDYDHMAAPCLMDISAGGRRHTAGGATRPFASIRAADSLAAQII